ncbi:MAG: uroporphyrinogen decarboxylase family protein [Phycisphaerae bacterium]
MNLGKSAKLAWQTIRQEPTKGIPSWMILVMEHSIIERFAGVEPGAYCNDPEPVYIKFQQSVGTCMLDQYIPTNPLTIGNHGYENTEKGATTGADKIVLDGLLIDSPEAVIEHIETFIFPEISKQISAYDETRHVQQLLQEETDIQKKLGPGILKVPYNASIPFLLYGTYGYSEFFMAYALYPEVMEKYFSLSADLGLIKNRGLARAFQEGNLPPLLRVDSDMADSRGTLVDIKSLDKIWFPHFARSLEPLLQAGIKMIWHCDGNLMQMVPRLLDAGLCGFQGFQYEDGMDYEKICKMKARNGNDLIIIAGVSVTRTLPKGKPDDVKRELKWLVEKGPKTGLFLGGSSSITPGVSYENIKTLVDGLLHYQEHGRAGL